MKNFRNEQRGRSMVEMMGYIAVVMTLLVSIGHIISSAFGDYKFSKANIQITELANSITKAGAIEEDYSLIVGMINNTAGTAAQKAEGLKLIPSSFRVVGRKIYHAFGGLVEIKIPAASDVIGESGKFAITYHNLNKNQCIDLAMKNWLNNQYADLYAIVINGSSGSAWYWPAYTNLTNDTEETEEEDSEESAENAVTSTVCKICTLPVQRAEVAGTSMTDNNDGQCKDHNNNTIMWVFN